MVKCFVAESQDNWDDFLQNLAFAYNSARHATTKYSPFYLMFGREPKIPADLFVRSPAIELPLNVEEYAARFKEKMANAYEVVRKNQEAKMKYNKKYHDRKHIASAFEPGDKVWAREFKQAKGECRKFKMKWKGPYVVETVFNEMDYRLRPMNKSGKRITLHRSHLKRFIQLNSQGNEMQSTPPVEHTTRGGIGPPMTQTKPNKKRSSETKIAKKLVKNAMTRLRTGRKVKMKASGKTRRGENKHNQEVGIFWRADTGVRATKRGRPRKKKDRKGKSPDEPNTGE